MNLRRLILGFVALLVVILIALGIVIYRQLNKETPKLGQTEGEMAFMSDQSGNWDIFLRDKDGQLINLTESSDGHEYFPNFTFKNNIINLYSTDSGEYTPATVKADGSDFKTLNFAQALMTVVAEGLTDWDPLWGPGGEQMIWSKVKGFGMELFIGQADGSDATALTSSSATEIMPAWSPDGTKVVFVSDESGQQNIYVLDIATTDLTRLTDHDANDMQPTWSTDGSQILFVSEQDTPLTSGTLALYIMNADGSDQRPFDAAAEVFEGGQRYSSDGKLIAYMSNKDGSWQIYLKDADGSNVRRITEGSANFMFPIWRPVLAEEQENDE
jgi:TolB protein